MSQAVKTLKLSEPIQNGSETITELRIRKPKAGDMRRIPAGNQTVGHGLDLLGSLSGQPKHVIDELSLEDMEAAMEVIEGFRRRGPETGSE